MKRLENGVARGTMNAGSRSVSLFRDRTHAGTSLARALEHYRGDADVVVLGLPPGGIPVAFEVAAALHAPLDAFVARPLDVDEVEGRRPLSTNGSGDMHSIDPQRMGRLYLRKATIETASRDEWNEIVRLERSYRGDRRPLAIAGRIAILIDDGMTPGAALRTAVIALRKQGPKRIVVAVPSLATATCDELATLVDEIVCTATPAPFVWKGSRYDDLPAVSEQQVRALIDEANQAVLRPA